MNALNSLTAIASPPPPRASSASPAATGEDGESRFATMLQQAPDRAARTAPREKPEAAPAEQTESASSQAVETAPVAKEKKVTAKEGSDKKSRKKDADAMAESAAPATVAGTATAVTTDSPAPVKAVTGGVTRIAAAAVPAGKVAARQDRDADTTPADPADDATAATSPETAPEPKVALPAQALAAPGKAVGHEGRAEKLTPVKDVLAKDTPVTVASDASETPAPVVQDVASADQPVKPGEATALLRLLASAPARAQAETLTASDAPKAATARTDLPAQATDVAAQAVATPALKPLPKAAAPQEAVTAPTSAPLAATTRAQGDQQPSDRDSAPRDGKDALIANTGPTRAEPSAFALRTEAQSAATTTGSPLVTDISAALDQQSINIGTSGQYIDDIAREIASVSASNGHGSFRLATDTLGQMRVDLTPGATGTDIRMTVDNEAAEIALNSDRSRLLQDAQLASVRIGEVRIDRVAHVADARSGDMGNGQNGNNPGNPASQSPLGQNAGQGNGQSARQGMETAFGQNGGGSGAQAKPGAARAVSSDSARGDVSARADQMDEPRARYA